MSYFEDFWNEEIVQEWRRVYSLSGFYWDKVPEYVVDGDRVGSARSITMQLIAEHDGYVNLPTVNIRTRKIKL